jgi:putative flippase GtrA
VVVVGFVVSVSSYALLTTQTRTFARHPLLALLTGIVLGTASNFLAARWYVFKGRTVPHDLTGLLEAGHLIGKA